MKALLLILLLGDWDFAAAPPAQPLPNYYTVREQAVRENKPLLVWIGYSCKSSERQLSSFLHHHATAEEAKLFIGGKAGVVVARMEDGVLVWKETVSAADVCASTLRRVLEVRREAVIRQGGD